VPAIRIRAIRQQDPDDRGQYVLYWMTAFRRVTWNFSLQRAAAWASSLQKPLVVLEALRCDYRWASDRFHHFVVAGMADNAAALARHRVTYLPYVEPAVDAGRGLVAALARRAAVVVSDDYPCFFLPRMVDAAERQIPTRFELVDSNGLLPLRAADRVFARAFDFRRFLQKSLLPHLRELPDADPLQGVDLPDATQALAAETRAWQPANVRPLAKDPDYLRSLPVSHAVGPASVRGGWQAGRDRLRHFLQDHLRRYGTERNHPDDDVASGLSPYLHFGHISAHQIFAETMEREAWSPDRVATKATGSAQGWWGASPPAESFLDELITWRELGFNLCWQREDYDQYESLPDWSQRTLRQHARDRREHIYTLEQFEAAHTHDELWNAAQRQLVREGKIHNYLRMLWGKKIVEWTATPREALAVMIELNNKYALDGRDPNSYSGIFWCLGRYDRAWGPERPIFGKVRYMSSQNTARKVSVKAYLRRYGP
jgi:deoxyribodipyrimidine photo-lyase